MTSAAKQREVIERIYSEGLNDGDLTAADRYLTPDFINNGSHDDSMSGPEAFKHTIKIQRSAFSDIKYEILDFMSDGDKAAIRWVMHGRHTGPFIGIPPTGLQIEHHGMIFFRFEGRRSPSGGAWSTTSPSSASCSPAASPPAPSPRAVPAVGSPPPDEHSDPAVAPGGCPVSPAGQPPGAPRGHRSPNTCTRRRPCRSPGGWHVSIAGWRTISWGPS